MRRGRAHQRGVALLLVLWLVVLLTALVGAFALSARIEHLQGQVQHRDVVGLQAARAGLEYAAARLVDPDPAQRWLPDGQPYDWQFDQATVQVRIVDETGKVDLNAADASLLEGLFTALGAADQAQALAGAILDWRDPDDLGQIAGGAETPQYLAAGLPYGAKDAPFDSVSELELVLGMTPALYARVLPHVTVYSAMPVPDVRYADGPVLQAMGLDPEPILAQRAQAERDAPDAALLGMGSGTYSIDSRARLPGGRDAVLQVVIRTGGGNLPGTAYTPLRWREGASASDEG